MAEKCKSFRTLSLIATVIAIVCLLGSAGWAFLAHQSLNAIKKTAQNIENSVKQAEVAKTAAEIAATEAKKESDKTKEESDQTKETKKQFSLIMKDEQDAVQQLIAEVQKLWKEKENQNNPKPKQSKPEQSQPEQSKPEQSQPEYPDPQG
jgi:FtsZ-interacting cell division protein ZipA